MIGFVVGCAGTLTATVLAQSDTGTTSVNLVTLTNTLLLVVLNVIAARNATRMRDVQERVHDAAPEVNETVQRTIYVDQNGDEHIVIHRMRSR